MTMPNKKANQSDRINDLPSNVIENILANLNIRDRVRTSILSTKWRYMWTSVPHLCFDKNFRFCVDLNLNDDHDVISNVITDILMLHNGPIHKFSIDIPHEDTFRISMEKLYMWIPFMSSDIKHLELLTYDSPVYLPNQILNSILSCKELTCLKLSSFNLSIPPNFCGFKKLLELRLCYLDFKPGTLESFISGCPLLEMLSIELCDGCDYLVISSPSIKVLVLQLFNTNLICLEEATNLIDFTVKGSLDKGFIKIWPKIKRFSLDKWEEIIYADIIPSMLLTSAFSSLEYWKLDDLNLNDKGDILHFVSLLKSAPRLIELVIKNYIYHACTKKVLGHLEELESDSCCLKLETVKIYIGPSSHHAMSLIKFILANSPLLKTLTLYIVYYRSEEPDLLKIAQDLLWMKRASPGAHVNFRPSMYRCTIPTLPHD